MAKQTLQLLAHALSIHSFDCDTQLPARVLQSDFFAITKTADELSIVCNSHIALNSNECESGWVALEVLGPLGFSLTGILSNISGVLAKANVSIFAISTFDTDYILVKQAMVECAITALKKEGYSVHI